MFLMSFAFGRRRKILLDFCLKGLNVDVTDGDYGHEVGPVPSLVEIYQALGGGVFDHFGQTNGGAPRVLRIAQNGVQETVCKAGVEALSGAPLLQDYATFQFHFFGFEGDGVGPIAENLESLFDYLRFVGGKFQEVYRHVEACIGVYVRAKPGADGLQVFDDFLLGKALGAVEGHVLNEVGEALLVVFFMDGAGPND